LLNLQYNHNNPNCSQIIHTKINNNIINNDTTVYFTHYCSARPDSALYT